MTMYAIKRSEAAQKNYILPFSHLVNIQTHAFLYGIITFVHPTLTNLVLHPQKQAIRRHFHDA